MREAVRDAVLFLLDRAEEVLVRGNDAYASQKRRELERLRAPLQAEADRDAEIRALIATPRRCCGTPENCSRQCWQRL